MAYKWAPLDLDEIVRRVLAWHAKEACAGEGCKNYCHLPADQKGKDLVTLAEEVVRLTAQERTNLDLFTHEIRHMATKIKEFKTSASSASGPPP